MPLAAACVWPESCLPCVSLCAGKPQRAHVSLYYINTLVLPIQQFFSPSSLQQLLPYRSKPVFDSFLCFTFFPLQLFNPINLQKTRLSKLVFGPSYSTHSSSRSWIVNRQFSTRSSKPLFERTTLHTNHSQDVLPRQAFPHCGPCPPRQLVAHPR